LAEIQHIQSDIGKMNTFLDNIKQLKDSSVCVLKRSKAQDESHECADTDISVDHVQDNIELLDLLDIQSMISNMRLNQITAADTIIFESKVWLYGDWTNKERSNNQKYVTRTDLTIEEEDRQNGYTNGAKSMIKLNHIVDFGNINNTASNIYSKIIRIVCKEYGIEKEESADIQIAIREFSMLDGNATICPEYSELDLSGISEGLYTERASTEELEGIVEQDEEGSINRYIYNYREGRKDIEVTQEQIDDRETISYEKRQQQNPKDVSIIDAVEDDLDEEPIPEPVLNEEAIASVTIPDFNDKEEVEEFEEQNRQPTDPEREEVLYEEKIDDAKEQYAHDIEQRQEQIDQSVVMTEEETEDNSESPDNAEEEIDLSEERNSEQQQATQQQTSQPQQAGEREDIQVLQPGESEDVQVVQHSSDNTVQPEVSLDQSETSTIAESASPESEITVETEVAPKVLSMDDELPINAEFPVIESTDSENTDDFEIVVDSPEEVAPIQIDEDFGVSLIHSE